MKKLRILTHDVAGQVTKEEAGDSAPVPGKKVKLDAKVGSLALQKIVQAKRENPDMTAKELADLVGVEL